MYMCSRKTGSVTYRHKFYLAVPIRDKESPKLVLKRDKLDAKRGCACPETGQPFRRLKWFACPETGQIYYI